MYGDIGPCTIDCHLRTGSLTICNVMWVSLMLLPLESLVGIEDLLTVYRLDGDRLGCFPGQIGSHHTVLADVVVADLVDLEMTATVVLVASHTGKVVNILITP